MAFGYAFLDPNDEEKKQRRALLEFYPVVAELSVLVIFAIFLASHVLALTAGRVLGSERPRSPSFDKRSTGPSAWLRKVGQISQRLRWWLRNPLYLREWGTRGEWIFGGLWTVWLLYLCVDQTGHDYMHLTKRFGIIGASQLPLHYLLAMRSPYSPIQLITRMSHEELKASHQVLGRIIYFLFALHTAFYLNFFIVAGYLAKRINDKDVIFGIISIIFFSAISTTAMGQLRKWNYRVFYISHILIANLVIVPLYLHVTHVRPYLYQVVAINVIHMILRGRGLKIYRGTVQAISGTNLVQVRIPLKIGDSALKWKAGQHVYLSLPLGTSYAKTASGHLSLRTLTNPFTVASIPAKDEELVLVARILNGNTKHLAELARSLAADGGEAPEIELALEGPYGASTRFPDFSNFDKILFVAGGVGATFVLPIYRNLIESSDAGSVGGSRVRFIWAVRKLAEIQWAFPASDDGETEADPSLHSNAVEVFVSRPVGPDLQGDESGEDIELLSMEEQMEKPLQGVVLQSHRPKISAIVDEVFSQGNRVAVIACGPKGLSEDLGDSVEAWVRNGHEVYFHDETFGW